MLAGPQTSEGKAIGKLDRVIGARGDVPGYRVPHESGIVVSDSCRSVRYPLHRNGRLSQKSVVTAGSVVVTTALSWATCGYFKNLKEFMTAVAVGYEMALRLGIATDGPNLLPRGVWPTYLAAAFGSATVTAKALRLSSEQTANALATDLPCRAAQVLPSRRGFLRAVLA